MTTITLLPDPPSRADPANFPTKGDAFLGALPAFGTQANALASEVNADKLAVDAKVDAGIAAGMNTVSTNIASVNTVSTNIANVNTVAGNAANVNAVAADLLEPTSEINTVATDIANVNTVGLAIANVNTVAAANTAIGTVSTNIANVNTVAPIAAKVTTVAGISANVTTVAGVAANVTTVAGISANVTTVAGVSTEVANVAANTIGWTFSATTTMADPGNGLIRFNNATPASVTAIAVDDLNSASQDVSAFVITWDDSTNTNKGTLTIRQGSSFAIYTITGLTDNVGWTQLAVTYVTGSGSFSAALAFVGFAPAGNKGTDGAGSGDTSSNTATSVDSELALFSGTGGKTIKRATTTGLLAATNGVPRAAASGTDVKTINGASLLGSGNVVVSGSPKITAVATGNIASAGLTVALNADGTVSVVQTIAAGAGSSVVFDSSSTLYISSCYDSTNQRVVIAYQDRGNSDYGTAIVGTVSGTSISFGTAVVFESAVTNYISCCYDSNNSKVVIAYQDAGNSNYGTAIVGTVSGTSISFGTAAVFKSTSNLAISCCYDSTNSKVVIAYQDDGNSSYGTASVGTVSGTSISFGTAAVFASSGSGETSCCYHNANGKVVIAYHNAGGSYHGTAVVGTVSGTSISFGTPVAFNSASTSRAACCYDSANQKVVIAYQNNGDSSRGTAIVGTVSGTSISFGTAVVFESSNTAYRPISCCYHSANGQVVICYTDAGNSNYGTAIVGTVSGTSISFGTEIVVASQNIDQVGCCYDSTTGNLVVGWKDTNGGGAGRAAVLSLESTNKNSRIGISEASATNGNSVDVSVIGATNSSVSGLTTNATYYVGSNGALTTSSTNNPRIGRAISATKILITDGI